MLSVLVVDGDRSFLDLFQKTASTWSDVKVATVSTVREAEEYLRDHPCDLVVSEHTLADRNGIDLLRLIRSRYGDLPYIMVTGHGSETIAAEASRFGISAYIPKRQDPVLLFSEIYGKIRMEIRQKEVVDALRERESRCRAIMESQPGFVCRMGPDMITTYRNPAFLKAMGISDENPGMPGFVQFISREERDRLIAEIKELTPKEPSFTIELSLRPQSTDTESPLWTEWTFTAAFDEHQHPTVIHGVGKDISWEKEHDALQKRQLENLTFLSRTAMDFVDMEKTANIFQYIGEIVYSLLSHSVVGVLMYDPTTNTEFLESVVGDRDIIAAFRQWFHTDLVGTTFTLDRETYAKVDYTFKGIIEGPPLYYVLLHTFPEDTCKRIEEQCHLGKTYVIGLTCQGELFGSVVFILRKGAKIENPELLEAFMNQASVALIRWKTRKMADEEIARVYADLEQKVRERTRNLEIANKNLESFSYSISHDLRAPLRSIDGFSALLLAEHGDILTPEAEQLIEKIRYNTVKMADLIDAILKFSRASRRDLERQEVDMTTLAREVLNEQVAGRPDQPVKAMIEDLPPCRADPVLIRQVWENLLSNALKFSKTRNLTQISIGSFPDDSGCVYYIRDNGIGFDMAYGKHLFKVFERLHEGEKYEGTGIGLAIVENIIRRHGGKIWMESGVDKGCTCYFTVGGSD